MADVANDGVETFAEEAPGVLAELRGALDAAVEAELAALRAQLAGV